MKTSTFNYLLITFALLTSGCVSPTKMAFLGNPGTELESGNSIYLLSVNLRNTYKTGYQPKLNYIALEKTADSKRVTFSLQDDAKTESEDPEIGNSYLTHFSLKREKYILRQLVSTNHAFLIFGTFLTPIHEEINVGKPGIYYLGHVDAVVRARTAKEFKAGPSIPLLDQSVVGASGGTFDIEISDQWETDRSAFLAKFPTLEGIEIISAVLAPFDRARAQKYWEDH